MSYLPGGGRRQLASAPALRRYFSGVDSPADPMPEMTYSG